MYELKAKSGISTDCLCDRAHALENPSWVVYIHLIYTFISEKTVWSVIC